jgi:DNA-binding CsgD family transcriptional regulator
MPNQPVSQQPQTAAPLDEHSPINLINEILKAGTTSHGPDDLCTVLVTKNLAPLKATTAFLGHLDVDGRVTWLGGYGFPHTMRSAEYRPSINDPLAITDSIRTGEIQKYLSREEYLTQYPHMRERQPLGDIFITIPFTAPGACQGAIGLAFETNSAVQAIPDSFWHALANICNLLTTQSWNPTGQRNPHITAGHGTAGHLTERGHAILERLALGHTSRQIAADMAYSESTIKQEKIKLFRTLGVHDRAAAVEIARSQGLIG